MLIQDPFAYGEVFAEFGLPLEPDLVEPLYPFAPVFLIDWDGQPVVLKHTCRPLEQALALAGWVSGLQARGVPVVAPVPGLPENPRAVGDDVWVVYPYIVGEPYEAETSQLYAAGALQGLLHADLDAAPALADKTWWELGELEDSLPRLAATPLRFAPEQAAALMEAIAAWIDDAPARAAWLRTLGLPELDCSCDFKANNLVFTSAGAVLIDPDLAGRQPRIVDLALACLLFHNEVTGGQGRLLTTAEWAAFLDGYYAHVALTEEEVAAWPAVLRHVFLGHGLWLVFNEYEIDAPVQQAFMDDLLAFVLTPDRYAL